MIKRMRKIFANYIFDKRVGIQNIKGTPKTILNRKKVIVKN